MKSLALAASIVGVLATTAAPAAAAHTPDEIWPPGNCLQGSFCAWAGTQHPETGPTETPTIRTSTDWSGNATVFVFYNYKPQSVDVTWTFEYLGNTHTGTDCFTSGGWNFYVPLQVTKVKWRSGIGC